MNTALPCFPSRKRLLAASALLGALLALSSSLTAANYYVTPAGAGSQNGSSWSNAYPQSQLQTVLDALAAGDTVNLGSGTYSLTTLSISGNGTASNPKRILGVDTGSGAPLFQGTFDVANSATTSFISFPSGANHWVIKNLRFKNHPFVINMPLSGTTDTLRTNISFENLAFDTIEDAIRIRNARNITVKDSSVIRHTKKAFRIGKYTSFITFERCSTDCNGGDDSFPSRSIPNGFAGDDTAGEPIIHDITFIDCTARNNRFAQSSTSYWNGDGFATEEGTYNVSYIRCKSFDNHDGGFDDKADNVLYQDCVAAGNKRGFRTWGTSAEMVNCVSAFNASWGGSSSPYGVWVSGSGGSLAISDSTFHNNNGTQVHGESGAVVSVDNSIISTESATIGFTSSAVTTTNTVTYRPGSGTNPNYVNPVSTWRGTPVNSMDSQTYGLTKGYNSSDVAYPSNAAPALTISATPSSGTVPLLVNFSATASDADGVIVSYDWDLKNGETSTVQNPSTTYTSAGTYNVTCTVTDNLGATTTKTVTVTASSSSTPSPLRIEAGGTSSFTDGAGNVWSSDHSYGSGGGIVDRGAIEIANTTDDRIYQTERWGVSTYAIATANGTYTVRLHFAETYSGITAAGQRVFSVTAEGSSPAAWTNIDVFAETGGRNIALIKTATITVSDGTLNLGFTASANNTMINGIELIPESPTTVRIEAGATAAFTDGAGNVWDADHSYGSGGGIVDRGAIEIANTTNDRIYQTERWGLSSYAIALANGTYTVRLHLAETYSGITAAGQRVFSVTAEGTSPTGWSNIDVFAETGGRNIALVKSATVSVSDGTLNLGFTASANNTMINGIEIVPAADDIHTVSGPSTVTAGTSYLVNVGYVALDSRRVYVEFRSPSNSILASSYVLVAAGAGTVSVQVTVPASTASGTGYRWTSKLKGSTGSPEYDRKDQTNVTVN